MADDTELTPADIQTLDWWTVRELANRWRCSADTVTRRIHDGTLKARKGMGGWRVHRTAIEAFERSGKVSGGPVPRRPAVPDELGLYAKGAR